MIYTQQSYLFPDLYGFSVCYQSKPILTFVEHCIRPSSSVEKWWFDLIKIELHNYKRATRRSFGKRKDKSHRFLLVTDFSLHINWGHFDYCSRVFCRSNVPLFTECLLFAESWWKLLELFIWLSTLWISLKTLIILYGGLKSLGWLFIWINFEIRMIFLYFRNSIGRGIFIDLRTQNYRVYAFWNR